MTPPAVCQKFCSSRESFSADFITSHFFIFPEVSRGSRDNDVTIAAYHARASLDVIRLSVSGIIKPPSVACIISCHYATVNALNNDHDQGDRGVRSGPKWVRLALNGTILGLFQISFQYILAQ